MVKLRKIQADYYTTNIKGYEFEIVGPDECDKPEPGYRWTVYNEELYIEEFFHKLKSVRKYLDNLKIKKRQGYGKGI